MTNTSSPYQPPLAAVSDQAPQLALQPASLWLRLANALIDYFMFWLLLVGVIAVLALSLSESAFDALFQGFSGNLMGLAVMLLYYIVMEAFFARTVGKFITGTKVVDESGGPVGLGQVVGRSFARFIPFEVFSYFGDDKRGWHDSLPRTRVVKCR